MPDLDLQIQMDHMQHMLHSHYILRVWRARSTDMLAELPMTLVAHIIGHFLAQGDLAAAAIAARQAVPEPTRKALATAPSRAPLRAVGVALRPVQEARHAARYARKGRKRKKAG